MYKSKLQKIIDENLDIFIDVKNKDWESEISPLLQLLYELGVRFYPEESTESLEDFCGYFERGNHDYINVYSASDACTIVFGVKDRHSNDQYLTIE